MASQDLKKAILDAASATSATPINPFAVSYLQLCEVSYLPASSIPGAVAKQVTPLDPGGSWKCTWGPAQDEDQSNLVFVAVYYSGGFPVCAVTVIRGTDVFINNPLGIIEQLWEDLDATKQGQLPWLNNSKVLVAQGTLDGLAIIQGLLSNGGPTLAEYLTSFLGNPANEQPVLIVTGHSLGGCLTTVAAPWLQFRLKQAGVTSPIVPATFAGPTAGNPAFAQYYDSCFSYAMRYFNTLDLAPMAWANLDGMVSAYTPCGILIPDGAVALLAGIEYFLGRAGVSYAQPFKNNAPLTGQCYNQTTDWYDEAAYQHHATTYMTLMGGASIISNALPPRVAPGRKRTVAPSRLIARFGGIKPVLAEVR